MTQYLFAVQDENGREVVSWKGDVDKVSEVEASEDPNGVVVISHGGEVVAEATRDGDGSLTLHRWPADDKLAKPVSRAV